MTDRSAFEGIRSATILKPGDRVLIDCGMRARRSDIEALHSYLKEGMPDVVFVVIGGARVVSAAGPACTCPPLDVTAMGDEPRRVLAPSYDPACPVHT